MPYVVLALLACSLVALFAPECGAASPPKCRLAILSDAFPTRPGNADPTFLKSQVEACGYQAELLTSEDIANPAILTPERVDCLVLPYGPSYPYAAYDTIKAYLKGGGSFLSMGGYVFDEPCERDSAGRMAPMKWSGDGVTPPACLNTRFGKPADTMGLEPDQIGVFDPAYHLRYGAGFRAAPMQSIVPRSLNGRLALEGYSACSLLGSNNPVFPEKWGRHIPLVDVMDSHGRLRGSAGSIALNYSGPYAGSSWAFFGVTNTNLFGESGPLTPYIGGILDTLLRKCFVHSLLTGFAFYRQGESVSLSCKAVNLGKLDQRLEVRFRVYDRSGAEVFASEPERAALRPGATAAISAQYKPTVLASDLYRVVAELYQDGKLKDVVESGFVAHSSKTTSAGPKLTYKRNYFHLDDRPVLLSGTNATGAVFYSGNENPLVWDRDLACMNENGLNILRVLHFSPFMSDKPSPNAVKPADLALERMPPKIERQLDALVQLCQKHNIALLLTIHDWMPVELSDNELAAQRRFAKLIAERYRDVPGFMIDVQNEPHIELPRQARPGENPDITKAWNDYLRGKYGSDNALKAAWEISPPESPLGSVPYLAGTDAWEDMRTFDADYFRNVLLRRWAKANYQGAKHGNPDVPVTVGFLQEYFAVNKLQSVEGLDFANMHSYNSMDVLRADLKLFDRRFEGKSLSLGEFGALPDHEKRVHGQDNPDQDVGRYLQTGHYAFGLGASFIASWCWKDMDDAIFPWGMSYTCGGPRKDLLKAYRNQSLLTRQIRPVYEPPTIFLVVPVEAVLGGQGGNTIRMLYRHVDALLDAHVDFGAIDDQHLDQLPASAKVLVYPVPMHVPDEAYAKLKSFVEAGGRLFVTGDISCDNLRRRSRTARLEELCGVRFVSEIAHGVDWGNGDQAIIDVRPTSAAADGAVFTHQLGKGSVRFTPIPSAMVGEPARHAFREAVRESGDLLGDASVGVHLMRIREPEGECVFAANTGGSSQAVLVTRQRQTPVEITLAPNSTGLVRYRHGEPCAIESAGPIRIGSGDDAVVVPASGHFALASLDGKQVLGSREIMVVPFGKSRIDLSSLNQLEGAAVRAVDLINGEWVDVYESADRVIETTKDTPLDIHIVAPKDRLDALGKTLAYEIMLR